MPFYAVSGPLPQVFGKLCKHYTKTLPRFYRMMRVNQNPQIRGPMTGHYIHSDNHISKKETARKLETVATKTISTVAAELGKKLTKQVSGKTITSHSEQHDINS